MRRPTKEALEHIAKEMVSGGFYPKLKGSRFLSKALSIHNETDSWVHRCTIKRNIDELVKMCDNLIPHEDYNDLPEVEKADWQKLYDYEGIYLTHEEAIDLIDSDVILRKAVELMIELGIGLKEEEEKEDNDFHLPTWSMFSLGEEGLRVIRGTYKGKYVNEIDRENFIGCAAGWARFCMNQNEELGSDRPGALTEDDKNVFLDIIGGKSV